MENKAKLYKKITNLANELGAIKEDGSNNFDHYKFISYQNVNARLRDLLPIYKLAIVPSVLNYEERDYTTSKGTSSIRSVVTMSFLLVDTETGYSEERNFVGGDQDTKGKSLGQAITECQKRFEMKLYHESSTEADPDSKSISVKPTIKQSVGAIWADTLATIESAYEGVNLDVCDAYGELINPKTSKAYTIDEIYNVTDEDEKERIVNELRKPFKKENK